MMKEIRKKSWSEYFEKVAAGEKNFELRKDEDGVEVDDVLILEEWIPDDNGSGYYTGRKVRRTARYIIRNAPEWGLMPGYCIIGF